MSITEDPVCFIAGKGSNNPPYGSKSGMEDRIPAIYIGDSCSLWKM